MSEHFCRSCGASIPHRHGEGRCEKCMEHDPVWAKREIERLSEIPCIVESPDGNPGWSTIGDAVKLLAAARRERDEVLAKTHDGTLWQPAYMLLVAERDRLRAALERLTQELDEVRKTLARERALYQNYGTF
jgi:hypothetical protein